MNDNLASVHEENLNALQEIMKFRFNEPALLLQALTHDSFCREIQPTWGSNERLEFLGDSVLGMIISHHLYKRFPGSQEGTLAQKKAYLVSSEFLTEKAREMNLGKYILLGKGEDQTGGRERPSVLTDAYEAIIGAIFIDQGIEKVEDFIIPYFSPALEEIREIRQNSKSLLQEQMQKYFKSLPLYSVVKEEGPAHQKIFFVRVYFRGEVLGEGEGNSKKEAEKKAALEALSNFETYLQSEFLTDEKDSREENPL